MKGFMFAVFFIFIFLDITIYYYKSNILVDLEKGVPVVLNINNSNQFLKCTFRNDKAVLSVDVSVNSL